jgi:riboflavin synthase
MFTGLIEAIGVIQQVEKGPQDLRLTVSADPDFMKTVTLGASISVNGVCLTVAQFTETSFSVDVSHETLSCTSLSESCEGLNVNLERCLTLSKPLGGHILTGHVHGVGVIRSVIQEGRSEIYEVDIPRELMKYMAPKGSVALDGISLTVNGVRQSSITVSIIPHTLAHTNLQFKRKGDRVNIEVDILCLYLERLVSFDASDEVSLFDPALMERLGFSRTEH